MSSRFAIAFPLGVAPGKWTRTFEQRFPDVELVARPNTDPLAALATGEADMVFARDAEPDDERHLIPLYAEDVVVVLHHEHLLTLEEEELHLADLADEPRVEGEPSEALMRSVAAGDGVALLPASVAKALRRRDVVALRVADAPQSRIGLTWPREGQHPLVDEFIGIVRGRTAHSSRNPEVAAREAADSGRKAPAARKAAARAPKATPTTRKRPRRR
ncbi:LysR family transcriptional regulator substrate-binding protein [Leifsonia shinshuensis]|uniref:LysR family transcriptional regulator substrate-binding protein n=1 Tax=Leifsonia shinshuensis TaxID=150026 RepID=UPI0028619FBE|nr:LysR family transcriptional regulator substrate-binding protein [Leifsonia shinshuensis]MDR6969970.1 DNA-binding transcriptional LysR family regulator [Leifsonia shinshuensis]